MIHSFVAQDSNNEHRGSRGESLVRTERKDEAQLCARELDKMGLSTRARSMRTVKERYSFKSILASPFICL